jgi:hypothetical protein
MTDRERLANRRSSTNLTFEHRGLLYTVSYSRLSDGRLGELFINNHKVNSATDVDARDAAIILSFALQHGADISAIARALSRDPQGKPTGVVGVAVDSVYCGTATMTRRARREDALQRAICEHLRIRGVPRLVWWHTSQGNLLGGARSKRGIAIQGSIKRGIGVKAGVSDLIFLHDAKFYALELKVEGRTPTEAQLQFIADVNAAGGYATWCAGLDGALACLEQWGLLLGRSQ